MKNLENCAMEKMYGGVSCFFVLPLISLAASTGNPFGVGTFGRRAIECWNS